MDPKRLELARMRLAWEKSRLSGSSTYRGIPLHYFSRDELETMILAHVANRDNYLAEDLLPKPKEPAADG